MSQTEIVYKSIGDVDLLLHAFRPEAQQGGRPSSAIVFFFGGGWVGGNPEQFFPQCEHFAARGICAFSAEYRVRDRHGVTPIACVADGKSAVRWIRTHAQELGVDAGRIAASGGSAGGHVAACCGVIGGFEEPGEDPSISSRPDALVLFNPGLDLTRAKPKGHATDALTMEEREAISPMLHVEAGLPPTIIFHGTEDKLVPFGTIERYARLATDAGNRCELIPFEGREHGFFNYGRHGNEPYTQTLEKADRFLTALGFLAKPQSAG